MREFLLVLAELLLLILKTVYYICKFTYRSIVPKRKKSVAGEIVLITGAGHGIGKELAICYASLGATVVCWDINEETNNETMNDIKQIGKNSVYAYRCNVADREDVFRVAEKVRKENPDEIARVIETNVTAHYWTLKAFLPSMVKKNHGHIVALSSIAGLICGPYGTVYCPTKFAVKAIMEAMSEELRVLSNGKSSVQFTTIYPSLVYTGIVKKVKIRFPRLMGGISPQEAASLIIDAQRKNMSHKSLPSILLLLSRLLQYLPDEAHGAILDFFDTGVYPDD
ncbi:PREDICTED: short-chain dehydrogenase/reductase family 16C member 6-like isoform X2 [Vollenhovia emeryi]|uniref:short-chain dehydrogenase/reductase family 16C member 6-like isoform X2 n=1 Tax=Vollenhovia emeryi TaxID=411798 RepID=UPI0005F50482|nr:PREDICTED: short-chain dehydrogenase/reductase family 16C member 6-like isoform X2 [Vollenhovia emeryi]